MTVRLRSGTLAAIALGGAAGTCARAEIEQVLARPVTSWPWATFTVNVSGAFLLGLIAVLAFDRLPPTRFVGPLLATGVCGAYTTFSTLVVEVDLLVRAGRGGLAVGYLAGTLGAGLAAVLAGSAAGRALPLRAPARR